jgi:hypothetical protein
MYHAGITLKLIYCDVCPRQVDPVTAAHAVDQMAPALAAAVLATMEVSSAGPIGTAPTLLACNIVLLLGMLPMCEIQRVV